VILRAVLLRLTELRQNEVAASVPTFVLESSLGVWHPAVGDNVEYVLSQLQTCRVPPALLVQVVRTV
jgi:hypothetical protein